ncbi:Aste57867_21089 [Aphanomyces stellatus]|uniref:Aste57867_21089 protein n=1 Tax=Aphanomyces stellatus TaxID=120398 RepID=A0A485LGP9_9STRA|nr:hypothetical protein As57867_021021 [Aphanomyces stellatus]VFT97763.1 Aste57867_21089 [Aphanomyces stellatus]
MTRDGDCRAPNALVVYRCPHNYWEKTVVYQMNPEYVLPPPAIFGAINDQCITSILGFLNGESLRTTSEVCRALHVLANDDLLWLHLCRAEWRVSPEQLNGHWKDKQAKTLYIFAKRNMERVAQDIRNAHSIPTWQLPSHTLTSLTRTLFSP